MQLEDREFNLCDFALFLSVMKNETAHRNILSIIIGEKDLELKEVKDASGRWNNKDISKHVQ